MKARFDRFLRSLGIAGVLGIGVLLACAGFWASALQPINAELAARRVAAERLQSRTLYQPASAGRDERREAELARFFALFPAPEDLADEVSRIHRLARGSGLELDQGEYRLERRTGGLWAYRVSLPVRGTYPQLRAFMGSILREVPVASLESVRFERRRAAEAQLDAQLRLTVHVRPAEGKP